ncbi:CHAD domain-containing protein [Microbacterium sp.]|jgi:CHAD domain-containing protein|uniref:CHAD domain-containing protein n=1 Tax=Microbacterium sp. TaxID=51671 RepID=UPI0025DA6CA8|nr:CHAD domain-containing protein [Microbacterium sp.]
MPAGTTAARPDAPAATIGALVQAYVGAQCDVILDCRAALAAQDESVVHRVRVAIRRLRATLRTFPDVYQRVERESLAKELKWAGMLLGEVRDLQVLAERFADPSQTLAVRRVIDEDIATRRIEAWRAATEALGGARGVALFAQLERWREDAPFGAEAGRPAARARHRVEKADAEVREGLRRTRAAAAAGDAHVGGLLHDARKAAKRHRYAVELAQPVLGSEADKTIEARQALQDALGAHQDAVVALAFLRAIDLSAQSPETARDLRALISSTRDAADDVAGALRAAQHTN